jgi:hypothetical protein
MMIKTETGTGNGIKVNSGSSEMVVRERVLGGMTSRCLACKVLKVGFLQLQNQV